MAEIKIRKQAKGSAKGENQNINFANLEALLRSYEGAIAKFRANRIATRNKFNPSKKIGGEAEKNKQLNTTGTGKP